MSNKSATFGKVGSGTIVTVIVFAASVGLLCLGELTGWDSAWRTVSVTPLEPHFFDMHVPIDYAICAQKGTDPYLPRACNVANFNIPPVWLWLAPLGVEGSDALWLSVAAIAIAFMVMLGLLQGRTAIAGLIASLALLSPAVLMGVERANPDLLILSLIGGAALLYDERSNLRLFWGLVFLSCGVVLKLFPLFCVAIAARFSRKAIVFASVLLGISLVYLVAIFKYVLLIRSNVPTTFVLSYGYKSVFLGLDHLRDEAGLEPFGLAYTWTPLLTSFVVVSVSIGVALIAFKSGRRSCVIGDTVAGVAFLFGSGIYCGTYLLGTNFIYRLMFLLLCVPQLLDWQFQMSLGKPPTRGVEQALLITVIFVLWLNGDANGHTTFLLVPQLFNWALFGGLASVLTLNFLNSAFPLTAEAFLHSDSAGSDSRGDSNRCVKRNSHK